MTREELVKRLAAAEDRRRGDHELNPGLYHVGPLTPAAVLVPLLDRPEGISVLLTQRTEHLRDHSGQISFPGGRIEPGDPSPEAAALREAEEEVGLQPELIEVIGRLDTYETRTGFEVTPVVGLIDPPERYRIDEVEVAEVFEVPLEFILDPANHERRGRMFQGQVRLFYVLPYRDRYIWGATAGMLVNLYEVLVG
ncbi:MAG: CoA pyrophosphatase [Alphaproteobacteria bacterium]